MGNWSQKLENGLGWSLGSVIIVFALVGASVGNYVVLGLTGLVLLFLVPASRSVLKSKGVWVPRAVAMLGIGTVWFLVIVGSFGHTMRAKEEIEAKLRLERAEVAILVKWKSDRKEIVESAKTALREGKLDGAIEIASKWRRFKDSELLGIAAEATRLKDDAKREVENQRKEAESARAEEARRLAEVEKEERRQTEIGALRRRLEAKNGNTVEEIHQIYTKLTELEPENLDWEKAARALEPEIQKIRDVRNAEAMAQAEAESNARLARRFSDCNVGFFGPSVRINGLGRAFWEYTLPQLGTTDLSGLVYHLADEAYSIAKACETAKQLQVTVRVTGLVDRFGASAPDVTATIDIDLVEARKFAGSAYYTQDDAVGAYLSVLISTSRIARFVDD